MKRYFIAVSILISGLAPPTSYAQQSNVSNYAGEEARAIKSLSADDIEVLRTGGGWGLAKAAELNGVPGPAHLLKMKDEIPLDAAQVAQITEISEAMKIDAIAAGERLIALEAELEGYFRNRTITDEVLRASLAGISRAREELRYIHLATHLQTPEILTEAQISKYNELRGYSISDPCSDIPEGKDPAMWRKHNGCV